jgi:hypothetical protein
MFVLAVDAEGCIDERADFVPHNPFIVAMLLAHGR